MNTQTSARTLLFLLVGTAGLIARSAFAQEDPSEVYQLGEVVVSARRDAGVESIGSVTTITAEQIRASGAQSLGEAIALVPGLYVRIGGAGTPRVDIRGFRTRHVQLLLDGIPINDTYDAQFDPTTIPVEYIARIKITTGGGSVLYGPGGNGGVINIITRRGFDQFGGSVAATSAEEGAYQGNLTLSGALSRWRIFATGDTYTRDGFPLSSDFSATRSEDGDRRENSDAKRHSLFASASYAHSPNTLVDLTVNHIQGENGAPPVTNYDRDDPFTQKAKYDRTDDLSGYGVQVAFSHASARDLTFRGWTYLNRLELEDNRYDDDTYSTQAVKGATHARSATRVVGLNLQVKRPVAGGLATLGLMAENDSWESDGFEIDKKDAQAPFDLERDLRVYSTALQYEAWPASGLGVVLGAAYHAQDREETDLESDFSFLLGSWYNLSAATRVRASLARKIRFPSIRQLYDVSAGNLALGAERTLHYELGLEQRFAADASATLTGFYTEAQDFIEKEEDLYLNYEEYLFKGIELAAEKRFSGRLFLRGSYAYLDSEDRSPDSDREELQHRPQHKIGLEGSCRFPFGLTPYVSLMRVAGQYFYDNDKEPPLEKKALDDYTLVDIKLRQDLLDDRLEIDLGADNLFDRDYEQSYGLPQPGRTLYAGFRCPF